MFGTESINIAFGFSPVVWGLALFFSLVFTYLAYRITNPPLSRFRKAILIICRFIAFICIFLMILEPLVAWMETETIQPEVAILWDNSRSISLTDRSGDRKTQVGSVFESEAIKTIRKEYPVKEYAFSDTFMPIEELPELDGNATALGYALLQLRQSVSRGNPLGAVVVVSDGQVNFGEDPLNAAYRSEFPIYTVGIGDPTPPKDIVLRQLTAQKVAYVGQDIPIIAGVSSYGYSGTETNILIYRDGEKFDEKRLKLSGRGELVDNEFSAFADTEGVFTYRVSVPAIEGELSALNNSRSVRVRILPSKKKILVIASEPNWELTFYLRALKSDPDLIIETAFTGKSSAAGDVRLPSGTSGLSEYDAVAVIGGIIELADKNWGLILLDYIKSGKGVHLHLLDEVNLRAGTRKAWAEIFPFIYSSGAHVWTEDEFVPELTVEGLVHSITRLSDDHTPSSDKFSKMPPLSGFSMATGIPEGGTILMSHPLLDDVPIVSTRQVDRGRISMFNGAGFWRWGFFPFSFGEDGDLYRNLISGDMAWLLAAGEGKAFVIETDRPVYRSGERVIVSAHLRDQANKPLEGAQISVKALSISDDTTTTADTIEVVLNEREGGLYTYELPAMDVGKWRLFAEAELDGQRLGNASASFLVEPYSLELENVQLNEFLLKEIATASGGAYLNPSEIDSFSELLNIPEVIRRNTHEKALWDHPILLVLFVLALCGEWILRKRSDLA